MAIQTMQTILCRAAVDGAFLGALLAAPQRTLQQYGLNADELELLAGAGATSLYDLAAVVEEWRRGKPRAAARQALALAG